MTITKSRGSTRKLGPISTGNKIVRFKIPSVDRRFTVHEDLICRTSALFKRELQKNRKYIHHSAQTSTSDCVVCHEPLDPTLKDITYCATCGQNIHDTCIEQWKRAYNRPSSSSSSSLPTCPMCRAAWKNEPIFKNLCLNYKVDAEAVQRYLDWLYSGILYVPLSISRRTDAFNLTLLKCWAVASAVDDETFKAVVVGTFFTEAMSQFWIDSVRWAFVDRLANKEIKEFMLDVFMAHNEQGWFKAHAEKWPKEFVTELADRALEACTRKRYHSVQSEWMRKLGIVVEEHGGDGQTGDDAAVLPYLTERANEYFYGVQNTE
ncbi:hypothetical protein ACEQ8H_001625 [Pleosporales sp. CAS-2024a]